MANNRPNNTKCLSNSTAKINLACSVVIEQSPALPRHRAFVHIDNSLMGSRFAYAPTHAKKDASLVISQKDALTDSLAGSRFTLLKIAQAPSRVSNVSSSLFVSSEAQDKISFIMKHFPSLFSKNKLIKNPVVIIKNNDALNQSGFKLHHCPSQDSISSFEKAGYLVIKHVGLKKCIDRMLELSLAELNNTLKLKEELNTILEDSISELEPFESTDDLILTTSGHTYIKKDLESFLRERSKKSQPEIDPISKQPILIKPIEDNAVKTFLKELDRLAAGCALKPKSST